MIKNMYRNDSLVSRFHNCRINLLKLRVFYLGFPILCCALLLAALFSNEVYASSTTSTFLNGIASGSTGLGDIIPGAGITASQVSAAIQSVQTPSSPNFLPGTSPTSQTQTTTPTAGQTTTSANSSETNLANLKLPSSIPSTIGTFGITDTSASTVNSLINYFADFFLGIIAFVAVLAIVYSGYMMITAGGDAARVATARKNIVWAIIGIIIAVLAWFIVQFAISFAQGL